MSSKCFVISPFGEPFDEYYEEIYKPAIEKCDIECVRADEIYNPGAIIDDIFKQISNADLVLCEATGKNPNVNYELGVAHAFQKPAIIITQDINDVPFDYKHLRVITYDRTKVHWAEELNKAITKTAISVISRPEIATAWNTETDLPNEDKASDKLDEIVISYSLDPSQASLRFRNQYVLLEARAGDTHPGFKRYFKEIYEDVERIENTLTKNENLQLRKIWHDDKNGAFVIWVDLIHKSDEIPTYTEKQLRELFHDGYGWYAHQIISVNARVISENIWSDNFFPNSPSYYKNLEF